MIIMGKAPSPGDSYRNVEDYTVINVPERNCKYDECIQHHMQKKLLNMSKKTLVGDKLFGASSEDQRYDCNTCGKTFTERSLFWRHLRVHETHTSVMFVINTLVEKVNTLSICILVPARNQMDAPLVGHILLVEVTSPNMYESIWVKSRISARLVINVSTDLSIHSALPCVNSAASISKITVHSLGMS